MFFFPPSFYHSTPCPALRLDVIDNIGFLSLPGKPRAKISSTLSVASQLINSAKLLVQGAFLRERHEKATSE